VFKLGLFSCKIAGEPSVHVNLASRPIITATLRFCPALSKGPMAAESDSRSLIPLSIADFEAHAKLTLDRMVWEYYFHGSSDELTRKDNREAFDR
jgi:hypothetical protein